MIRVVGSVVFISIGFLNRGVCFYVSFSRGIFWNSSFSVLKLNLGGRDRERRRGREIEIEEGERVRKDIF